MITKRGPIHNMGVNAVLIAFWQKILQHDGPTGGPTGGQGDQQSDL